MKIRQFYPPFESTLKIAEDTIGKIEIADEVSEEICELCGKNMVFKQGKYGKFLACPGFPDCRNTKPIVENTGIKCPKCTGELIVRKTKRGKKFYGCNKYPECDFVTWDEPTNEICPKCSVNLQKKASKKGVILKCMNEACDFEKEIDKKEK